MAEPAFESMSREEQIQHVMDLWDRIADSGNLAAPLPEQLDEVQRRRAEHLKDPGAAIPLDEAQRRLRERRG